MISHNIADQRSVDWPLSSYVGYVTIQFCLQDELTDLLDTTTVEKEQSQQQVGLLQLQITELKEKLRANSIDKMTHSSPRMLPAVDAHAQIRRQHTQPASETIISKDPLAEAAVFSNHLDSETRRSSFGNISTEESLSSACNGSKDYSVRMNSGAAATSDKSEFNVHVTPEEYFDDQLISDKMDLGAEVSAMNLDTEANSHKMSVAEVLTDSSGESWPDGHYHPELSDALSSDKTRDMSSTLERSSFRGNDEVDGGSPFRVTEIPVSISVENPVLYSRTKATLVSEQDCQSTSNEGAGLKGDKDPDQSEEEPCDPAQPESINSSSQPSLTRDKTLKIFKQLKKAKQRSKKCLAPTPKVTKSLPDIPAEVRGSDGSAAHPTTMSSLEAGADDSLDVAHVKKDIIAKSGGNFPYIIS